MKKQIFIICLLLVVVGISIDAQEDNISKLTGSYSGQQPPSVASKLKLSLTQEPLVFLHAANMGVLISLGDLKIMIDGLFTSTHPDFRNPTPETLKSMINGEAPFDGVDLVLVTHKDQDHFNAAMMVHYMETHSGPILVAPSDAVEEMRKAASDCSAISSRVIPIDLKIRKSVKKEVAHIPLTIIRTTPGTSTWPMNLMSLIDLNGWCVFHEGDASGRSDDYRGLGLESFPVDLVVVQYSWPIHPHLPFQGFLLELLKPEHIALAHINIKRESTAEVNIEKVR